MGIRCGERVLISVLYRDRSNHKDPNWKTFCRCLIYQDVVL
ncbi:hypothetical protein P3T40_000478 [Paraburkholderia sp. EB58]|jgi:hypothetical protein